jgi:zinc carboxypeptidase
MPQTRSRRRFLQTCAPAAALTLSTATARSATTSASPAVPTRKDLTSLRAKALNGEVHLTAYKSTPAFQNRNAQDRFRTLRVYRREQPTFTFGQDYAEYFDGLPCQDAALIFQGPLEATNNRKFTYVDDTAKTGSTYAYWMAPAEGQPTGPVAVKVRDPEIWWTPEKVEQATMALQENHPDLVKVSTVGRTVRGQTIHGIQLGTGSRRIALIGAIHAGESGPELILPALERILTDHKDLLAHVSIAAIPSVNLDERRRLAEGVPWYLRTNANGVDLNRNYPADWETTDYNYGLDTSDPDSMTYRGPAPASEPETRAVIDFLRANPPEAVFSFHCLASICGAHLLGPKTAAKDDAYANKCRHLASKYCHAMDPSQPTGNVLGFGTSAGSLPTWCYRELQILAFDLEISSHETEARAKCVVDRTDRPLLKDYQQRHTAGLHAVLQTMIDTE